MESVWMIGQPTGQSLLLIDPILKSGASKRESRTLAWRPSAIKSHHGGNVYNTLSCTSTQLHCWVICNFRIAFMVHRCCYICFMLYPVNIYRRDDCANYQLDNFLQTKIRQATSKVLLNGTEKELIHGKELVSHSRAVKSP